MPTQIPYTSTLPPALMQWLDDMAAKHNTTKKDIIVRALTSYQLHEKQSSLAEGFDEVAHDLEILAIAEDGLEDALNQIHSLEQS